MSTKKTTGEVSQSSAARAAAQNPPPPPGGGSWKWDAAAQRWVSNDQPVSTNTEQQE
jgi:hypothetical protein